MPPSSSSAPKEWPQEVKDTYEPVRVLGKGGFACVTLAKPKNPSAAGINHPPLVAMKIVDGTSDARAYAHREVDILRELNHPNIMKVIDSWEPNKFEPAVIALSYSKGPTVLALLKHGGSLSSLFSRVVNAQLVDAISYLHGHAVVHRDIKPDNIIVTGALSNDDSIWDNVDGPIEADEAYWEGMRKKWKATLIDFGFARALTPEDVIKPSLEVRKENLDASYHANNIDLSNSGKRRSSFMRLSSSSFLSSSRHGLNDSRSRHGLNSSRTSRTMRRAMSAVGNHEFAAPEIRREMHEEDHADPVTVTDTIGHTVSEYGLLVDAYSLGCTLRFMMTGCLPRVRVKDAISEQNNLIYKLIGTCVNRKKKRQIRYRLEEDLPAEAQRLISKMTEKAEKKRTSVRAARRYPWVADVLNESSDSDDKIKYLQVVLDSVKEKGLDDQILEA